MAYDPSSFIRTTVIISGMWAVREVGLTAGAIHIVHRKVSRDLSVVAFLPHIYTSRVAQLPADYAGSDEPPAIAADRSEDSNAVVCPNIARPH